MSWYTLFKRISWVFARLRTRVRVEGLENVPREGPFILLANHQSILDPILIQSHCPRDLHTLTKSTQFGVPFFGWWLPRVNAIPTRRFKVDPQVVRVILRRLSEGKGIGIYPEGERSWDAEIQPFRRGTMRVVLKAGVPVIPCGVSGSYDVWPRWSKRMRRASVTIRYGEAITFGAHDDRAERERAVPEATERIREALEALSRV
jgi:1-acyl-sn-glycerol-3-phosphate acyltransferase